MGIIILLISKVIRFGLIINLLIEIIIGIGIYIIISYLMKSNELKICYNYIINFFKGEK